MLTSSLLPCPFAQTRAIPSLHILGTQLVWTPQHSKTLSSPRSKAPHSPTVTAPVPSEPPEEVVEDTEEASNHEDSSPPDLSSSSPDETIMPPPLTIGDNFRQFQDLFKRVSQTLDISLEEIPES